MTVVWDIFGIAMWIVNIGMVCMLCFMVYCEAMPDKKNIVRQTRTVPLYAYRAWRWSDSERCLRSPLEEFNKFPWRGDWTSFRRARYEQFRSPGQGNRDGLYGTKRPGFVLRNAVFTTGANVIGVMELAGTVCVHSLGYRAEYGRPVALGYRNSLLHFLSDEQLEHLQQFCAEHEIVWLGHVKYRPASLLRRTFQQYLEGRLRRPPSEFPPPPEYAY